MGVTFWGNFASGTLFSSISLAWHVLCASVQPGRVVVRARSCRNGARILDVADPCEVLQHWQDFSSQSSSPAAELIVGRSRHILYTPPKGSAMFPCEEATLRSHSG
jgi:hypothetical protein